jgi:hypothetical protein
MVKPRLRKITVTTDFYNRSGIHLEMPEEFGKPEQTFIVYVMNWRRNKEVAGEEFLAPCEVPNTDNGGKTLEGFYYPWLSAVSCQN